MEEQFFFQYHLRMCKSECLGIPVYERKWMIERFIQQKNRENAALEASRKKAK